MIYVVVFSTCQSTWSVDDILPSEFNCGSPALVSVAFPVAGSAPIVAGCGTEIAQAVTTSGSTSSFPTITFAAAAATSLYSIVVVDQDAGPMGPIGHSVVANVPGNVLSGGLTAANAGSYFLEPYNGPGVSAGMGCHRYNVIVYVQAPGVTPYVNMSTAFNYLGHLYLLNFNFPVWASQYGLTRVASQMWQTQAAADRAAKGACAAPVCCIVCVCLLACFLLSVGSFFSACLCFCL